MIATALLLLAQSSGQTPPLEDYLPGGPERVQAKALEWLEKAEAQLARHEAVRIQCLEQVLDSDEEAVDAPREVTLWMRRSIGWEFESGTQLDRDLFPGLDLMIFINAPWEHPAPGGYLPAAEWLGSPGPELSQLSATPLADGGVRLFWVRDGIRGTLDLDQEARPLAWTWHGDGHWDREKKAAYSEVQFQVVEVGDLPEGLQRDDPLFWSSTEGCGATRDWTRKSAEEVTELLLSRYASTRRISIESKISLRLGSDPSTSKVVGELTVDGNLLWPCYGGIRLEGQLGLPGNRKEVLTEICGLQGRYWHWDRIRDEVRPVPGLADLLAGFQGVLPLYAWAAREFPSAGLECTWLGERDDSGRRWLRVKDGPTVTDFLIEKEWIEEMIVRASEAGADAPVLHYREMSLGAARINDDPMTDASYPVDGQALAIRLQERDQQVQSELDPRLAQILRRGDPTWDKPLWRDQDASRERIRDRPRLLVFWQHDPLTCESVLRTLDTLIRRLQLADQQVAVRALCADPDPQAATEWYESLGVSLPLGFADQEVQRAFRARWLPTTYLIGADGVVLGAWLGDPGEELAEALEKLPR